MSKVATAARPDETLGSVRSRSNAGSARRNQFQRSTSGSYGLPYSLWAYRLGQSTTSSAVSAAHVSGAQASDSHNLHYQAH